MRIVLLCALAAALVSSVCIQLVTMCEDARLAYGAIAAELLTLICGTAYLVARIMRATKLNYSKRMIALCANIAQYAAIYIILSASVFCIFMNGALLKKDARDYELVIHAGGGGYLNSEEMTAGNVEAGYRYIELDFLYTSDHELVCSHRFEFGGYSLSSRPTFEEFIQTSIKGSYTGLTLQGLLELLKQNQDFSVVFDTKEEDSIAVLSTIRKACERENIDFYSRFIVQLYSVQDYIALQNEPFTEFWFTNYKARYSTETIEKYFGGDPRITTVVLNLQDWTQKRPFGLPKGKKIAVHTVNKGSYIRFLAARGVDYIYTDLGAQVR